ncbi:TIGR01620 family protein [Rhodobacter sp. HX-7-19]|uniref:TIGR01620 family protein n=1 Tax=Paragemmobacter kunshanensis TaxID=2583234 RepID=A0A6M1TVU2_9RHOB|nr:TIGR01620 family protein [Rhodobacter kunshanensis]NGQ92260.1 TIGR01620 family protein [Rhodobacter kunshanensis]
MTADKPFILELETRADPALAPPVPDLLPDGRAMQAALRLGARRPRSALGRFAIWAFGALFSFILSVAAWDFVTGLLTANTLLGTIALTLVGLATLAAALLALREAATFARLAQLDGLRQRAAESATLPDARRVTADLAALYARRGDMAWSLSRLKERQGEVLDADALLRLAEGELMAPLDTAARAEVEAAARQVATVTALVPLALADVAMALFANLRMIRRIAEIYGGRAGTLGSMRLLRRVFGHLVATGAVALTDDLIGSVAGGGVLSKLSRRFGEGVVNGALTARVGIAAMEICRPLPFAALPRPSVTQTLSRALAGLLNRGDTGRDEDASKV